MLSSSAVNLASTDITGILPIVNGGSPFEVTNGAINERITNQDFLLGGVSTASAKFAITNVNSGTPTASISGTGNNATYLTATGNLTTTNGQTLTLGGSGTGNVSLVSNGTTALTAVGGNVGVGTTAPAALFSVGSGSPFQVNSTGAIAAATGVISSGSIRFSDLNAVGIVHTDANGVLSTSAVDLASASADITGTLGVVNGGTGINSYTTGDLIYAASSYQLTTLPVGTTNQLLTVSGGIPTWVTSSAFNFFQRNNGAIAPLNVSDDFLLGGGATASAKFGFLNNAAGTPTASISAGTPDNYLS
ncbi:MAG: hypothetical protein ACREBW_02305, partial [Candidatus Micrarchaeaceae archaeon]